MPDQIRASSGGRKNRVPHLDPYPETVMLRASASVGRRAPTLKGVVPSTPTWRRALPVGVIPAYDEALKLINDDATRLRGEERALHQQIADKSAQVKATAAGVERDGLLAELEEIRKLHRIVDVQSQVNLPKVRWAARHGYCASCLHLFVALG